MCTCWEVQSCSECKASPQRSITVLHPSRRVFSLQKHWTLLWSSNETYGFWSHVLSLPRNILSSTVPLITCGKNPTQTESHQLETLSFVWIVVSGFISLPLSVSVSLSLPFPPSVSPPLLAVVKMLTVVVGYCQKRLSQAHKALESEDWYLSTPHTKCSSHMCICTVHPSKRPTTHLPTYLSLCEDFCSLFSMFLDRRMAFLVK